MLVLMAGCPGFASCLESPDPAALVSEAGLPAPKRPRPPSSSWTFVLSSVMVFLTSVSYFVVLLNCSCSTYLPTAASSSLADSLSPPSAAAGLGPPSLMWSLLLTFDICSSKSLTASPSVSRSKLAPLLPLSIWELVLPALCASFPARSPPRPLLPRPGDVACP